MAYQPVSQPGTWLGLPDFGLTESLFGGSGGTALNNPNVVTGGAALYAPQASSYTVPPVTQQTISNPYGAQGTSSETTPTPTPTGQVQGTQTTNTGTGGSNFNDQQAALINSYNNMIGTLQSIMPSIQQAYNTQSGINQQQMNANQQAYNTNQQYLQNQNILGQGQLSSTYNQQLARNREIARALGSFGSDYGQLQNMAGSNYAGQQAGMNNQFMKTTGDLTNQFNQGQLALQQAQAQLGSQYNQALANIAMSVGQTDAQKIQALSNLQNNYNYMNSLIAGYRNYTVPSGSNVAGQLGTTAQTFNPMTNVQALQGQTLTLPQTTTGVAGAPDLTKNPYSTTLQ